MVALVTLTLNPGIPPTLNERMYTTFCCCWKELWGKAMRCLIGIGDLGALLRLAQAALVTPTLNPLGV